jgi:hypothetical protein
MIVERDADGGERFRDDPRHVDVGAGRRRVTRRMIVDHRNLYLRLSTPSYPTDRPNILIHKYQIGLLPVN